MGTGSFLHKHFMQTSEVQCPEIKMGTKIQCSITKTKYLKGEVKFPRILTEMEHLNRDTKIQHLRDDICFNEGSLKMFHQNVESLRSERNRRLIERQTNNLCT